MSDDGPETASEDGGEDEIDHTSDDRTAAKAPAATFMEIDGRPDASPEADSMGVIANPSPAQIAEYISEAAASSQSEVNEFQPASVIAAAPALEQDALTDSDSAAAPETSGHQRGRTARKRNIPSRYRADVFHTQGDAHSRRMAEMDLALVADWGNETWVQAYVISVRKAMSERPEEAEPVMRAELQQMVDKKVWHAVHAHNLTAAQRSSILRSSMFLKDKYLPSGEFEKFKARLVAGGDMQDKGLYQDKMDLASPTAATSSVFVVTAIAAHENRTTRVIDIGGAFLLADIKLTGIVVHVRLNKIMTAILVTIDPSYVE